MQPGFSWQAQMGGCSWGRDKAGWSVEEQDNDSNDTSNQWNWNDYHWFLWDLEQVLRLLLLQIGAGLQGCVGSLASRASLRTLLSMACMYMQRCLCPEYLCSLGILPTFQIPIEKIVYLFSAPVTGFLSLRERQRACLYFLRDSDYYCYCTAVRSWSLEVLFKRRPVFMAINKPLFFLKSLGGI